jgi:hypothetical protein
MATTLAPFTFVTFAFADKDGKPIRVNETKGAFGEGATHCEVRSFGTNDRAAVEAAIAQKLGCSGPDTLHVRPFKVNGKTVTRTYSRSNLLERFAGAEGTL